MLRTSTLIQDHPERGEESCQGDGVRAPLPRRWHTQGRKGEFTSCRGTSLSAWLKYLQWHAFRSREDRAAWKQASGRHVVRGRQSSPIPDPNSCSFYCVTGRGVSSPHRKPGKGAPCFVGSRVPCREGTMDGRCPCEILSLESSAARALWREVVFEGRLITIMGCHQQGC